MIYYTMGWLEDETGLPEDISWKSLMEPEEWDVGVQAASGDYTRGKTQRMM